MNVRACAAVALLALSGRASAQQAPAASPTLAPAPKRRVVHGLPGEALELKTKDGWTLSAQYYPSQPDHDTFILLHTADGRKENWLPLARAMIKSGFGYLALDLRGHGGSQNPPPGVEGQWWKFKLPKDPEDDNPWADMVQDVDAAVAALKERAVPENQIAVGGAEVGSSIAMYYAASHPEVPMTFLLTPGRHKELPTTKTVIDKYGSRPILMVVGQDDKTPALFEAGYVYQMTKKVAGEQNVTLINVEHDRGTRMLIRNRGLVDRIIDWMEHPMNPASGVSVLSVSSDQAPGAPPTVNDPDSDLFPVGTDPAAPPEKPNSE